MEETLSLQDILKILKKRASLIVTITIVAVMTAAIISFFLLTPIYQASTQVLVHQKKEDDSQQVTTSDIQSNLQLIYSSNEIITSPAILSIVLESLDLHLTPAQLEEKITVSNENDSQILNISVQDENYNVAVEIMNQIVEVFKEEFPKLMNVDNVNVLSLATSVENPSPIKPNKMLNVVIALVLGLMFGIGLAFLLEYLDKTVKTEQDIEELIGLPILGLVSPISEEKQNTEVEVNSRHRPAGNKGNKKAQV